MPDNAAGKVPAVVLVHGSGPSNMDGIPRAYPNWNAPFKDIAEYLAAHGIAVIRYDKRTYSIAHARKFIQEFGGSATVYEETIEDAILAANILKNDSRIDENKVFIAGLSMGGMLAPRIHAEGGNFAGIISLAGTPRSVLENSYDQNMAFAEAMEEGEEKETAFYQMEHEWWDFYNSFLNLPDDEAKITEIPGTGVYAYYFKDWVKNPTPELVQNIDIPFLIMQGSADFQVYADKDFVAWQELLAGRDNATFKLYDGLNHMFMTSTTGNLEEYKIPANVDAQVLADIVEWIKAN